MSPRLSLLLWQWWCWKDYDDYRHKHHWRPAGPNCLSLFHSRWCKIGVHVICPPSLRHHCHHRCHHPFCHRCHQHHRHCHIVNTRSIVDAGWHLGCSQIIQKKSRLIPKSNTTTNTLVQYTSFNQHQEIRDKKIKTYPHNHHYQPPFTTSSPTPTWWPRKQEIKTDAHNHHQEYIL